MPDFEPEDTEYLQYFKTCFANQKSLHSDDVSFVASLRSKLTALTEKEKERLCFIFAKLDSALRGKTNAAIYPK